MCDGWVCVKSTAFCVVRFYNNNNNYNSYSQTRKSHLFFAIMCSLELLALCVCEQLSNFLNDDVMRRDVDAAWSGLRPLARDPASLSKLKDSDDAAANTASISRDHVIEITGIVCVASL